MLDVCLLGTGGMMPLPYRALTSMMIRYNGSSILVDCGEGTQVAVKQQGWSFKPIDVILFTFSCRSYQRIAWATPDNRKCRTKGSGSDGWAKTVGTGSELSARDRTGASI